MSVCSSYMYKDRIVKILNIYYTAVNGIQGCHFLGVMTLTSVDSEYSHNSSPMRRVSYRPNKQRPDDID